MSKETKRIKPYILRALLLMDGQPMPEDTLRETVIVTHFPRPLVVDYDAAMRELETAGFVSGNKSGFDDSISWTLTDKGEHQAKQLG